MRRLCISLFVIFASSIGFAAPVFGGNMPAIRSDHFREDSAQFDLALSYLKAGDIARMQTVAWAVQWDPSGGYDFRGIDAAIQKTASKGLVTVWLLQASPHPSSGWYPSGWSDWFLPKREIWPGVVRLSTAIAQHIKNESKKYSTLEPLFQLWNEPQTGKPGGSIQGRKGEWASQYHELLFSLATDLRANGVPKSQIVGPAVSSFGEAKEVEDAEFETMMPPPEFDWLSECGYRDVHLRLSAGGGKGGFGLGSAWNAGEFGACLCGSVEAIVAGRSESDGV